MWAKRELAIVVVIFIEILNIFGSSVRMMRYVWMIEIRERDMEKVYYDLI